MTDDDGVAIPGGSKLVEGSSDRNRIIQAAFALSASSQLSELKRQDLARSAGVVPLVVSREFHTRDDLMMALRDLPRS